MIKKNSWKAQIPSIENGKNDIALDPSEIEKIKRGYSE